jgi:hypothetical protein
MVTLSFFCMLLTSDFPICEYPEFQNYPCVLFADSIYYTFWSDHRLPVSIFAGRVRPDGTVMDSNGVFLYHGNTTHGCRAAFDGQNLLAVFRDSC